MSSDEIYSLSEGWPGKQKRLSSVRLPSPEACNGTLAFIKEKYPVSGFKLDLSKKKQTAQVACLFTRERLPGMMEWTNHYTIRTVFSFLAAFTRKSLGFVKRCNLTGMNVLYIEMLNDALF